MPSHFIVDCPQCSRQLRLPVDVIGKVVKCPLCQVTFEARETASGNVEGRPLDAPLDPNNPAPVPPARAAQKPAAPPNLSLDDDPPVAPKRPEPYRVAGQDNDVPEAAVDDDRRPPRRDNRRDDRRDRWRDDRPRGRGRDRYDDRPRDRRGSGVNFAVLVLDDPDAKFKGRFSASIDNKGLCFWRGSGRLLEVPLDQQIEHPGGARLVVPLEGRKVELSVVEPDGRSLLLTEQIVDFYAGKVEEVRLPRPKKKSAGRVVWLALLPLAIPLLTLAYGHAIAGVVGMILLSILALALVGVSYLFLRLGSWSVASRVLSAGPFIALGFAILGIAFLFDRETLPPQSKWKTFTSPEGTFTTVMPGEPTPRVWLDNSLRGQGLLAYEWRDEATGYYFAAGVCELRTNRQAPPSQKIDVLRNVLTSHDRGGGFRIVREHNHFAVNQQASREFQIEANFGFARQFAVSRVIVNGNRILVLYVRGPGSLNSYSPEVKKFFESSRLEPLAGAAPDDDDGFPPDQPPEDLGVGGRIVSASAAPHQWAGFSRDGNSFAAITAAPNRVSVWDNRGFLRVSKLLNLGNEALVAGAYSHDGSRLAAIGNQGSLTLIHLGVKGGAVEDFPVEQRVANWATVFSPDGKTLATAGNDGFIRLYDVDKKALRSRIKVGNGSPVLSLAYSPDGQLLAAGTTARSIHVYRTTDNEQQASRDNAHDGPAGWGNQLTRSSVYAIRALEFSADSQILASTGHDQKLRLWDARLNARHVINLTEAGTSVSFYRTGRLIAAGSSDGVINVYDSNTGWPRGSVRGRLRDNRPGNEISIRGISYSGSNDQMVAVTNSRVELYETSQRIQIQFNDRVAPVIKPRNLQYFKPNVDGLPRQLQSLTVCGNGSRFGVVPQNTGHFLVYAEATLKQHGNVPRGWDVQGVALSPNGTTVAVARETRLELYSSDDGSLKKSLTFPVARQLRGTVLAYSADGSRLAVGQRVGFTQQGEVEVYDVDGGPPLLTIATTSHPTSVAFSPDGRTIAIAVSNDKLVHLFDAATGREYAGLVGHDGGARSVAFSPDGKTIATQEGDSRVRLFDAARCKQTFEYATGRPGAIKALAFSPDGSTLAVGDNATKVDLIDVPSGKRLRTLDQEHAVVGLGFGPGGNSLVVGTTENVNHWDLREVAELKKRPAPVVVDFSRVSGPEIPDLQTAESIEAHLCHVVDVKGGYLLAFTRDKLCLHYSYPGLSLQGACHVGALVYKAALDVEKGTLFAATTDAASLVRQPTGYQGKGSIQVFDARALREAKSGRVKPTATVRVSDPVRLLGVADGGRDVVFVETNAKEASLGRFDAKTYKLGDPVKIAGPASAAALAPDGKNAYVIGRNGQTNRDFVQAFDLAKFTAGQEVELTSQPQDLTVTDTSVVLSGMGFSAVEFRDRKGDKLSLTATWRNLFNGVTVRVSGGRTYVAFSTPPSVLAFESSDKVDNVGRMKSRFQPPADETAIDFTLTPDGKHLISSAGRVLRVGSRELVLPTAVKQQKNNAEEPKGGKLRSLGTWKDGHGGRVLALTWSTKGDRFLSGGADRWMILRSTSTDKIERQFRTAGPALCSVAWARDDRNLIGATWDDYCEIAPTMAPLRTRQACRNPGSPTNAVAFSRDGKRIVVARDKDLEVWTSGGLGKGQAVASGSPLSCLAVATGADVAAAGAEDGRVRIYEVGPKPREKATFEGGHDGEVRGVAIAPDGKTVVSGGADGKVKVWDVEGKKETHSLDHGAAVLGVAMACDGKLVASSGIDGSVKLWDASTGKEVVSLAADGRRPASAVAFSPDGKELAVAAGATVRRYDASAHVGAAVKVDPPLEPPTREEATDVAPFQNATFDVKGGQAFLISAVTKQATSPVLTRLEYPSLKRSGTYKISGQGPVSQMALDVESKTLYVVRCSAGSRQTDSNGVLHETNPRLYPYDVRALKPNKSKVGTGLGATLNAPKEWDVTLRGEIVARAFSPDAKWLYVVDAKEKKLHKIATATGKTDKSADVADGVTGLCVTPNGATVWVISGTKEDSGKLEGYAASDLKAKGNHTLDLLPLEVVATDGGVVCVAGKKGKGHLLAQLDAESSFAVRFRVTSQVGLALCLSADQANVYLSPRDPSATFGIVTLPTKGAKAPLETLMVFEEGTAATREMVASPDGLFLIQKAGVTLRMPKK